MEAYATGGCSAFAALQCFVDVLYVQHASDPTTLASAAGGVLYANKTFNFVG